MTAWRCLASVAVVLAAGAARADQPTPGFACTRATRQAEQLVCADTGLAASDRQLTESYRWLLHHMPAASHARTIAEQRAWLARRDACADTACVAAAYDARLRALWAARDRRTRQLLAGIARVGQCQVTTIEGIGPRLDTGSKRPDRTGTSVTFANGLHQVSYELERAVARSRIGDRAKVCLVSIPQHCPPGDDRGRWYQATNLRTGDRWKLPDAQHMCGGA